MGGKVFPNSRPVTPKEAQKLIFELMTKLGINLSPIGSIVYKEQMNDIDVLVLASEFSPELLTEYYETKKVGGFLYSAQIDGVQVDFMPVVSFEWGHFAYGSGPDAAKRAQLLKAIAYTHQGGGTKLEWHGDTLYSRVGWSFDMLKGLRWIHQHRKGKTKTLKNLKTVTAEEFNNFLSESSVKKDTITNVADAKELLFTPDNIYNTAEFNHIWASCQSRYREQRLSRIKLQMKRRGFDI